MRTDPGENVVPIEWPPERGPGSSRQDWILFACRIAEANTELLAAVEEQSAMIRELQAEVAIRRGGRPPVPHDRVAAIEAELADGASSRRAIAARNGVSAMTVTRVAARVAAREALAEAPDAL